VPIEPDQRPRRAANHSPALLAVLKPEALHSEGRAAVWAYGSRVRHTARPHPDLDPVVFTSPAQRWSVGELKEALSESDLPFAVDLHVWDEVPERFHEIIRKEYVVLVEALQQPAT
jgi:predicted nucleotidyltransferase